MSRPAYYWKVAFGIQIGCLCLMAGSFYFSVPPRVSEVAFWVFILATLYSMWDRSMREVSSNLSMSAEAAEGLEALDDDIEAYEPVDPEDEEDGWE